MALIATHTKFALDVSDKLNVGEMSLYLSGTNYPDSRYITHLPRPKTHDISFQERGFYQQSDFTKGWAVHLLCDRAQSRLFREKFAGELEGKLPVESLNEGWVVVTALKILQDIAVLQDFSIGEYLHCFDYVETPNDEDPQAVASFGAFAQQFYESKPTAARDYLPFFTFLGLPDALAAKVIKTAEDLARETTMTARLLELYAAMVVEVRDVIS